MKNNKLISLFLALLVCFSLVVTVSATTDNQNLAIAVEANASTVVSGNTISVAPNGTIKVSVMINENPGNLGVNFDVKWKTDVLEYVGKDLSGSAFSELKVVDNKSDRIVITLGDPMIGVYKPELATKIAGTGKIADFTFKVKSGVDADISTAITIERASYASLEGKSVEHLAITNLNINLISSKHVHTPGAAATCTTNQICTHCFAELVAALGHKGGAAATCTTNQICTVCSVELEAARGHKPGAAATCTTSQTCTACNVELVAALGHKPGAAATCSASQTCTVCKVVLAEQLPHSPKTQPSVAPTCTATGLTQGSKCRNCGKVLEAQKTVAALGHDLSAWVNNSPNGHWKTCKTCNAEVDFAAHTMTDGVCSVCDYGCNHTGGTATCSAQAICTSCNKPYGEMLAHTPGAAATCTSEQKCTVCQAVIAEKLDHALEIVEAKAATCGAIGWEKYEKCKNCDYTTYKEIAATGAHTFGEWTVVSEATTKEPGKQTQTCTVCGFAESKEIPVLEGPVIPVLWIVVLVVLIVAAIVVIILFKKKRN